MPLPKSASEQLALWPWKNYSVFFVLRLYVHVLGHTITKIIAEVLSDQASSSRQNVLAQTQTCPSSPGSAVVHFAMGRLVGQSSTRSILHYLLYHPPTSHVVTVVCRKSI